MLGLPYSRISKAAHKSLLPTGRRRGPRLLAWEDEGLSVNATDPHPPNRRAIGPLPLPVGRGGPWVIFKMFSSCSYARNREMSPILAPMGWKPAVQRSALTRVGIRVRLLATKLIQTTLKGHSCQQLVVGWFEIFPRLSSAAVPAVTNVSPVGLNRACWRVVYPIQ